MYPSRILSSNLKSTQNQIRSGKNLFIFHRQTTNPHFITLAQSVFIYFLTRVLLSRWRVSSWPICSFVDTIVFMNNHQGEISIWRVAGPNIWHSLVVVKVYLFCTCPSNILMLDTLYNNHRCCHITQTPELISWSANVLSLYGLPLYLHIVYMNLYNYTKYVHTSPSKCRESQSRK